MVFFSTILTPALFIVHLASGGKLAGDNGVNKIIKDKRFLRISLFSKLDILHPNLRTNHAYLISEYQMTTVVSSGFNLLHS